MGHTGQSYIQDRDHIHDKIQNQFKANSGHRYASR